MFWWMEWEQLGIRISNTYTPCSLIPFLNGTFFIYAMGADPTRKNISYASWHVVWENLIDMQVSCYKNKSKNR